MVHENCGVVAAFSLNDKNVIPFVIDSLRALQHRGQEAWGVAVPGKPPFKSARPGFNGSTRISNCY